MFTDKLLKLEKINKSINIKYIKKPLIFLIVAIFCTYLIHKIIFFIFDLKINLLVFNCSLEKLYFCFGLYSIFMIVFLSIIKQKNIDIVGNVSMLLTVLKMLVCGILKTLLNDNSFKNSLEKKNFLITFLIFLVLETVITIYLLNRKED